MHHLSILTTKIGNYPFSCCFNFQDKRIYLSQTYSLNHWDHYFDVDNHQRILLLGRPAIEPDEWRFYDDEPAFVTRIIAQKLKTYSLEDVCRALNGSFTLLILDSNEKKLTVVRDKLGVYPIFLANRNDSNRIQISTHPDLLASNIRDQSLDDVSVAEFLCEGYISHPNTFYKEISSLDPGSFLQIDFQRQIVSEKKYFSLNTELCYDFGYLKNELTEALYKSIERRTNKHYGKTGVLLSGGGDSRPLAAHSITKPVAFTSYFNENNELRIASEVAKRLDIEHVLIKRSLDSMLEGLTNSPYYTGGMSTGGSATFLELLNNPAAKQVDNLLTGDYADWLLKDIAFNTEPRKVFGKKLPLNRFSEFSMHFYGGHVPLKKLQETISQRRLEKFGMTQGTQTNQLQLSRIVPLSNEYTSSSRLFLQRTFPWESYFIDNDVIDCVLKTPPEFKLNGKLLDQALKALCLDIADVPHAAKGTRIGTNLIVMATVMTMGTFREKYLTRTNIHQATWDNPKQVMLDNSNLQRQFYSIQPKYQAYVSRTIGIDLFSLGVKEILQIDYHLFYNVISFCSWLETNDIQI